MQIKQTDFVKSVAHPSQIPSEDFPQIAFSGRSNVGKSSLINRLMNRRNLAQTSNTPGKTRLLNFYLINRNLHFVDLPGYGFAKRSKAEQKAWAELIDAYLRRGRDDDRRALCRSRTRGPDQVRFDPRARWTSACCLRARQPRRIRSASHPH